MQTPSPPTMPLPPQPFQVDNIADVWTILTAIGTTGAAIGTVAAFWLAAITYQRQVGNDRAVHAARITLFADAQLGAVVAENLGELPVYAVTLMTQISGESAVVDTRSRLGNLEKLSIPWVAAQ